MNPRLTRILKFVGTSSSAGIAIGIASVLVAVSVSNGAFGLPTESWSIWVFYLGVVLTAGTGVLFLFVSKVEAMQAEMDRRELRDGLAALLEASASREVPLTCASQGRKQDAARLAEALRR